MLVDDANIDSRLSGGRIDKKKKMHRVDELFVNVVKSR